MSGDRRDQDVIVVGGGVIGAAIAYGLTRRGVRTLVLDESDRAFRAARGNFGLVWVQGKGVSNIQYAAWTRRSADLWAEFNDEIKERTRIDTRYLRSGGLHLCLDEEELASRSLLMANMAEASEGVFSYEMLDHDELAHRLPGVGPSVAGASFSAQDGHVDPLSLLHALHTAFKSTGGMLISAPVTKLCYEKGGFEAKTGKGSFYSGKIVLAAGLGSRALAPQLGLNVPVRPERGQILVTERLKPFLDYPTIFIRQTEAGSVLLGDSHEEVGFDDGTDIKVMSAIANRARLIFPRLERTRILRAWGALRILTPDGLPVYQQSRECPGAFTATGHSGVTLAAAHTLDFARFVADGEMPAALDSLGEDRFHVH
ncbi:MAG: FAD-binding oxidoreductase [Gammaproteobacteria bacterium]|nr:FAD-binding oxidoreductase [Gammaproteobacteria bacterium]